MKTMKRFLALLLVLAMTLSNLPVAVLADELTELVTGETIVEETVETPVEEPTEAPSEEETTAPSEEPTEEPSEAVIEETFESNFGGVITNEAARVGNGLPIVGIYSSSIPDASNLISGSPIVVDPDVENVFYYGFNRYAGSDENCTFEPIDGAVSVSHADYLTVEKISEVVYKLTLTDAFFEYMETSGNTSLTMTVYDGYICHWYAEDGSNETHEERDTYCSFEVQIEEDRTVTSTDTTTTHASHLGYFWVGNDENNVWSEDRDLGFINQINMLPKYPFWVIFYMADWDADAEQWVYTPVHHSDLTYNTGYMTMETMEYMEYSVTGENAEYYTVVTPNNDMAWNTESTISYTHEDGVTYSLYCWLGQSAGEFFLSHNYSDATVDTQFTIDPNAEENAFWWYFNTYGTYELVSAEIVSNSDKVTVEQLNGLYEWKLTFTEDAVANAAEYGDYVISVVTNAYHKYEDQYESWYTNMYVHPPVIEEVHDPYLTFAWLEDDGNGMHETDNRSVDVFRVMPGSEVYHIYYLNTWNSETGEYEAAPVHVRAASGDMTFTAMDADEIEAGQTNGDYFYRVTTDTWDQSINVVTELSDGTTIGGVTGYTDRGEVCFYNSTDLSNASCVTADYLVDISDNPENELYIAFEDSYWTAESFEPQEYCTVSIWLEDTDSANIKRVCLTEEAMENLRSGGDVWIAVNVTASAADGSTQGFTAVLRMLPDQSNMPSYLTFGWLNEDGNGWYENGEHSGDVYRVMPGQEVYHIYYLNTWNSETGGYEATPVHVQANGGDLTLELVGAENAAEGQENGAYFYRVTTGTWDQGVNVVTTLENGTTVGGVTAVTDRNEAAFYTSTDMSNDTVVSNTYLADLSEGAENAFYVGFDSNYWTFNSFWVEDWCSQWIWLEECGLDNMRRVRFSEEAMDQLRNGGGLWLGVGFDTTNESGDESLTFYANCAVNGDLSSVDPFLSFAWLDNWGEGWFEQEDRTNRGFGFVPGDEYFAVFFLNQWNDEQNCLEQIPVHITGGDHIFVNPVTEIAEGQENGDYFVSMTTDVWDQNLQLSYTMDDGTVLTMDVWTGRHELGWYTSPELSNDTWYGNYPLEIDPFEENSIYLGLNNSEFNILGVYPAVEGMVDDFDLEQVNEKVWKVTLTENGLAKMMNWYLLGAPLTVDIVNIEDESWVESRFVSIDFSRMELESDAWLRLDYEPWELFVKDGQQLWGHQYPTDEVDEDGNTVWACEMVSQLPIGLTYDYDTNTLTMEDYDSQCVDVSLGWYDENEGVFYNNLPSANMTIELRGENSLVTQSGAAMCISNGLNVTFTGDGSLYMKAVNDPGNLDDGEHPFSFPTMDIYRSSVTFADSVDVTVEIAGEGLESCWDDTGYMGDRPASLIALNNEFTTITLQDNATLTTVVPEGASNNGPFLEDGHEDIYWGDHTPGGYGGIRGSFDLNVYGGTLNTQGIYLGWGHDENGVMGASNYTQTGGTVNIDAMAYNGITEKYEWNEETQQDEYVGDVNHYYYSGLEAGPTGTISISGGVLNIDTTPTAEEMNSSSDFNGINTMGGTLNISGGEVNFTNDGYGMAIFADTMYDENGNVEMGSVLNISGGTLNFSGEEGRIIDGIRVRWDSTANFTGGIINTEWTNWFLRGDVLFENTVINGSSVYMEFNGLVTMNSGEILLDEISEIGFLGEATMNGGKIDIHTGMLSAQFLHHFGGDINIWNQREGRSWASFIAQGYYEMHNDASLTIYHEQLPPAVVVEGTFHQMGGTVDVTHVNTVGEPAVTIPHHVYEDGTETHGTMFLNDGTFNIHTAEGGHILGFNVDEDCALFVGGMEEGDKPVLNLTNADIEGNGIIDLKQDAVVTMEQGTLNMFGGSEIIMDMGAAFTMNVSKEHSDEWDIAFLTGDHSSVTVGDATLNITTEGYDCAFDLNGDYNQNGGNITINNVDGDMAMAVKGIATFNGGTIHLSGNLGYSQVYEPTMSETSRFVFNRGTQMYVDAKRCGIEILSAGEINGGSININVEGLEEEAYNADGNYLGKVMVCNGILLNGWNYEDSELVINGGTHRINAPQSIEGDYLEADTNGIRALQGKLDIQGCRMFIKAIWPIVSNSNDESDMLTMADGMDVYSLNTGAYLVPVDCTVAFDAEGNFTEDLEQASIIRYLRSFAENNETSNIYTGEGIDNYVLVTPNVAGETLTWKLENGILRFYEEGAMFDFSGADSTQWAVLADFITEVEMDSNVTVVGDHAFNGLDKLTTVTFLGTAPEFHENAFAGVVADAYYPYGEPSWTIDLMQDYGGDINWVIEYESEAVVGLTTDKETLLPAEKATLTATIFPNIDPEVKVVWTLGEGDGDYVTLRDNKDGTATVTAKKIKALQEVTVYADTNLGESEPKAITLTILPIVTKVNILNEAGETITGTTQTLNMYTGEANTMALFVRNDPNGSWQKVTWKSANTKYATVDENGVVTALVPGKSVKITATATDGSKKYASVTIKTAQPMEELILKDNLMLDDLGNTFIAAGKSLKLATAIDIYPANTTNKKLEWSVSENDYGITINKSTGVLATKKLPADASVPVIVTVTAKAMDGSGQELTFDVSVYPAVTKVIILGENGEPASGTQKLYLGADYDGTLALSAENTPDNSLQAWTWKSSNTKYATVDGEGVVTGLTPGKTVTITATAADGSGKKATVKVAIEQVMESVTLSGSDVVAATKSITLKAEVAPANTTNKKLTWEIIEGSDLAKISTSGKLTALKGAEGVVTVRVSSQARPEVYATWHVTIMANAVYKVDIQNKAGESLTGTQELIMGTNSDNTMDLYVENTLKDGSLDVSQKVIWKSSNTKHATVDENGTVTMLVPSKTVTITATAADGSGKKDTVKIKGIQPVEALPEAGELLLDEYGNRFVAAGKSLKLAPTVEVFPANATNKKLVWTVSENEYKITVNKSTGVLSTKALPADAKIPVIVEVTATAADAFGAELTFLVSVYPATTKVTLWNGDTNVTGKTISAPVGSTLNLLARSEPANAADIYTWKTSNASYATVENGEVTLGDAIGKTVTITVTAADGSARKTTVKIKITEAPKVDVSTLTEEERAEAEAEIRRALSLLIDRNAVSMGQMPASSFVSMGMTDGDGSQFYENAGGNSFPGYWSTAAKAYAGNCEEAMTILSRYYDVDEEGKLVGFPEMTYIFNEGFGHGEIAEKIQEMLASVGITIHLTGMEWDDLQDSRGAGNYDIARHGWISDYNDPIGMLDMWTSYSGNNDAQLGKGSHAATAIYDLDLTPWGYDIVVENGTWAETYDVLIGVIKDCGMDTVRYALMHLAEDMLMESGCIVPLYYYTDGYLLDSSVKGFGTNPMGLKFFQNTTVGGSNSRIAAFLCWEPYTMDPALNSDAALSSMIQHMFSGLAKWAPDADGSYTRIVADCAEELVAPVVNADGTVTYTYTLKEDLYWSDGVDVTAYDFEFAWKRAASTALGADYGYMFEQIQGYPDNLAVTAEDDRTLTVTLNSNVSYWNELLAFTTFMPVREDVVADAYWATSPETYVTNGAYTMTEWEHDFRITLEKNADYWDAGNVTMKEINFYLNGEAVESNWASGAWQFVDGEFESFQDKYASKLHMAPNLGTYFLLLNANQPLLP